MNVMSCSREDHSLCPQKQQHFRRPDSISGSVCSPLPSNKYVYICSYPFYTLSMTKPHPFCVKMYFSAVLFRNS